MPRAEVFPTAIALRLAATCLCACSCVAQASDWTLSAVGGKGNHVDLVGIEAQLPSGFGEALSERWFWYVNWAGDVAYWWAPNHNTVSNTSLWEAGFTPVIGVRRTAGPDFGYYMEGGIGVHLLSHTAIDDRILSTAFQFGEFVGAGVNFGDRGQYGFGLRIQHFSNGSIKEPNCGVTLGEVRVSYRWD
jgi:hypothetical protein